MVISVVLLINNITITDYNNSHQVIVNIIIVTK